MLRTQFSPLNIANLSAWWDASDTASITLNGTAVSQWNDKSGNGRHVTQSTANNQPAYTATLNGLNVVTFDGSNDQMSTSGNYSETKYSAFAVIKSSSVSGVRGVLTCDYGDFSNRGPQIMRSSSTTYQAVGFQSGAAKVESPSTAAATGTTHVISVVQTASALEMWINNVSDGSTSCAQSSYSQYISIGVATNYILSGYFSGDIAEVLLYARDLSTDERQIVQRYLGRRWGVSL